MSKDEPKEHRVGFYGWIREGYGIINIDEEAYNELKKIYHDQHVKAPQDFVDAVVKRIKEDLKE